MLVWTKKDDPELLIEFSQNKVRVLVYGYQRGDSLMPIDFFEHELCFDKDKLVDQEQQLDFFFKMLRHWLSDQVHMDCRAFYLFLRFPWVQLTSFENCRGVIRKNLVKLIHLVAMKYRFYLKDRSFYSLINPLKLRFFQLSQCKRIYLLVDPDFFEFIYSDLSTVMEFDLVEYSLRRWFQKVSSKYGVQLRPFVKFFWEECENLINSGSDQIFCFPQLSHSGVTNIFLSEIQKDYQRHLIYMTHLINKVVLKKCLPLEQLSEVVILGSQKESVYLSHLKNTLRKTLGFQKVWVDLPVYNSFYSVMDFYLKWIEIKQDFTSQKIVNFQDQCRIKFQKTWEQFWG